MTYLREAMQMKIDQLHEISMANQREAERLRAALEKIQRNAGMTADDLRAIAMDAL